MSDQKKIIDTPLGQTQVEPAKEEVVEEAVEEVQLTEGQKRMLQSMRRRNIILGSIFGVGAIALATVFFVGTSQNTNVALSTVSNVVNPETQVTSYDSEWFANAIDIVLDANDVAYFTNDTLHHIYKLENGKTTIFAGSGENTFEDGSAEEAAFAGPAGLAIHDNSLYVADKNNNKIRKVDLATGRVTTLAGSGNASYEPGALVDGNVNQAKFNFPSALVVDSDGTIYVADSQNNAIRKIAGDTVSTLAGNGTQGDTDALGSAARFNNPKSVAILDETTLLVADTGNNKLKTVNKITGETRTFAGNGLLDLKDGLLLQASFYSPSDVIVTEAGNIFISDTFNHAIRVIPRSSDSVYVLTGNGEPGFKDGIMAEAMFSSPIAIAEERSGAILVVDAGNRTIRRLQ
jgi:hypothetical protein